jgi:hypothetical protein
MAKGGMTTAQGRQQKKNASQYKEQARRTEKNKTKKIVRHFKSNPTDYHTSCILLDKGYKLESIALTSKGRKLERRAAL